MTDIAITPLDDNAAFLAAWETLFAKAPGASFFQSPAWMKSWLEGAPGDVSLRMISAMQDGELVLLGVFSIAPRRPPLLGLREGWFQEFGEPKRDAVYPEYMDFLAREDVSHDLRRDVVCALIEQSGDADSIVFRNLRDEMMSAVFSAAAVCEMSGRVLNEHPVYGCALGGEGFMTTLSPSLQSKIARSLRLYQERGPLSGRLAVSREEKASAWESLQQLHKQGWEARGGKGAFDNPHLLAFHERLQRHAPEETQLFVVKANDDVIAVLYNFAHKGRVMNYQSGLKYEDDNKLAPGFVAHALAAQFYQDKGFEVYDLLAGEADYKARLAEPDAIFTSLALERDTWRNRLRAFVKR